MAQLKEQNLGILLYGVWHGLWVQAAAAADGYNHLLHI